MDRSLTIRGKTITDDSEAYVVAELSHNHQGSLDIAKEMCRVAKECGADAMKVQKRSKAFYAALRERGLGDYADLRESRELSLSDYWALADCAHTLDLAFIATAFDLESLAFLQHAGVDAIKLASGAVHNSALLEATAKAGLPVLLSTGCADWTDVLAAMGILRRFQCNICLLQCTSSYPCADADMQLRVISLYRSRYQGTIVGLSSHHPLNYLEPVAFALGARVFEKHFTLSRELGVGDHANSLDASGLASLCEKLHATKAALGSGEKRYFPCEEIGRQRLDVIVEATAQQPARA